MNKFGIITSKRYQLFDTTPKIKEIAKRANVSSGMALIFIMIRLTMMLIPASFLDYWGKTNINN